METIDHDLTDEIVCPHCGYKMSDSWDYHMAQDDQIEIECDECGGKYKATCVITVEYSTEKLKGGDK